MADRIPRMPGGVLIPSRLTWETLDDARSSYTESGSRPGVPEAVTAGAVYRVHASGGQGEDVEVTALRSGYPGTMAIGYRLPEKGETADSDWRGWNPPMWWEAWTALHVSTTTPFRRNDIVCLPDTQVPVVVRRNGSNSNVAGRVIDTGTLEADAAGASVASTDSSWEYLAACVLPDQWATGGGRILLLYTGRVYSSADAAATWQLHSKHPIAEDTATYGRVRMAHRNGQVLLLVEDDTTADTVHQYVSVDGGATFKLVESIVDFGDGCSIAVTDRGFVVVYARDLQLFSRRLANAGQSLSVATEVEIDASVGAWGIETRAVAAEPDGTLWCCAAVDTGDNFGTYVSADSGDSWELASGILFDDGSAGSAYKWRYLSAVFAGGRLHLVHSWQDGDATIDGGLGLLVSGGHSNWTSGPPTGGPGWEYIDRLGSAGYTDAFPTAQVSGRTWTPVVLPEDSGAGWTRTGSPAPTLLTTGYLEITTAAWQILHDLDIGTGAAQISCELVVDSGGTSGTTEIGLTLRVADGTDDYRCQICLTANEITVRDAHAATQIAAVTMLLTTNVQLQALLTEDGVLTVGYRRRGAARWQFLVDDVQLTSDTATPESVGNIAWGHEGFATGTSRWRWFTHTYYTLTYQPRLYRGDDLYGRAITGIPTPIAEAADADGRVPWLRATAGPARHGEVLLLPAHHEAGVQHLFPAISPSPSTPWRALDEQEQVISFDLGDHSSLGRAVGLFLGRANFRTAVLEFSLNGSSWTTAGTLDLAEGFTGINYTRAGNIVEFASGGNSGGRYLWPGELAGGGSWVDSGGAVRRIAGHSGGALTTGVTTKPDIRIDLQGSEPASGTMDLVAHSGLLVVYPAASVIRRYWRVRIPAQVTADGYFEAGIMAAGRVQPWGAEVDLTRSDTWSPNISEARNSYGVARLRERGPLARTVRFGWNDGAWRGLLRGSLDLPYLGVAGGLALGAGEDVAELLAAIMREVRSGAMPVVLCEPLPDSTSTITDPTRLVYGHLRGSPSANGFAGDPVSTREFVRVEAMTLEEIP